MPMTSGNIMDRAAVNLNDASKVTWTYTVLLPYLRTALDELELLFANNGMSTLKEISSAVDVAASSVATSVSTITDILAPLEVFERLEGQTSESDWVKMTMRDFEDNLAPSDELRVWAWREEVIRLPPCSVAREIKVHYYKKIADATSENGTDNLTIENSLLFLSYRTAALAAEFGGEQPRRAESLNAKADKFLTLSIARDTKLKHGRPRRRKPFGYRRHRMSSLTFR